MKKITDASVFYDLERDVYSFRLKAPLSVCWQITTCCNLCCRYCLSDSGPKKGYGLTTDKAKQIIDMLGKLNVGRLDFTGGEPFIRKDIKDLVLYSIEKGINPIVTTNTLLLSDEDMKFLAKNNVLVQVSIDGKPEVHNSIRGANVYDLTIKNIKKLKKFGCRVRLNSFICKSNVECLDYLLKLGEELELFSHLIILFTPQGRGVNFYDELLNEKDRELIKNYLKEYKLKTGRYIRVYDYDEYAHSCVLITPLGDVISQALLESDCINVGNVFKTHLEDLFQDCAFDHFKHLAHYIQKRIR